MKQKAWHSSSGPQGPVWGGNGSGCSFQDMWPKGKRLSGSALGVHCMGRWQRAPPERWELGVGNWSGTMAQGKVRAAVGPAAVQVAEGQGSPPWGFCLGQHSFCSPGCPTPTEDLNSGLEPQSC